MRDAQTPPADDPVVVLMLKTPRAGTVKTRLSAQVGVAAATAIYRLLVDHQISSIPRGWRTEIHFAPADAAEEVRSWLGQSHAYFAQVEGDLGARLTAAVAGAFSRGASTVIVVGGDCPELDESCLRHTRDGLTRVDVVMGPAADGGYYLIALRQSDPRLFDRIPWSTENVLALTLARIAGAGLRHALLDVRVDVDDLASLRRIVDSPALAESTLREKLLSWLPPRTALVQ